MQISDFFEIVSIKNKVLHIKVIGFWSNSMVDNYGKQIVELWQRAVLSFNGEKFISLPDLSEFKSQEEKGQNLITSLMKFAQEHNLYHSVQYVPTAIVR